MAEDLYFTEIIDGQDHLQARITECQFLFRSGAEGRYIAVGRQGWCTYLILGLSLHSIFSSIELVSVNDQKLMVNLPRIVSSGIKRLATG